MKRTPSIAVSIDAVGDLGDGLGGDAYAACGLGDGGLGDTGLCDAGGS